MPTYEYCCERCIRIVEELRRVAERREPAVCPDCGEKIAYLIPSVTSFILKGKGWSKNADLDGLGNK